VTDLLASLRSDGVRHHRISCPPWPDCTRAAIGDFSIPVLRDGKRPIVRCADKDRYISLDAIDQQEVRVAVYLDGTNERFAKTHLPHATLRLYPDNRTIFDEIAAGHADVMVTDGTEVDYPARLHPGILCPAVVADSFDHTEGYWITHDPALKGAVDTWLKRSLSAGDYEKALRSAATGHP
jgi:cyclohexadienyl dehydratase